MSELTKLAERFLIIKSVEYGNYNYDLLLLNELKKRNLNDYFEKEYDKITSDFESSLPDVSNAYDFLQANNLYMEHLRSVSDIKSFVIQFKKASDYKIAFFIIDLLEQLIQVLSLKYQYQFDSSFFLEEVSQSLNFNSILSYTDKKTPAVQPLLSFYYSMFNAYSDPLNHQHYEMAKKIFNTELKSVGEECRLKLYSLLVNYNILLQNKEGEKSNRELFRLMEQKLKEGLFGDIQNKDLSMSAFRNCIMVATMVNEYDWIENFINEFGPKLPEEIRTDNISFGKALLSFKKGEYFKCLEIVNKVKKSNTFNYIDISLLKLMAAYELQDFALCHDELRRLVEYIRHKRKVQQDMLKYTKDFCTTFGLLLKLREQPLKKNLIALEFNLKNTLVIYGAWIRNKVKKIKLDIR